jgi:hypothetical protein
MEGRDAVACFLENAPGLISAAVVHDDDFVRNVVEAQLHVKLLDGGCNAALFVTSRDNDAEAMKGR